MVKLFEEEIHIMQLFYANQSIRNVRDISNATHDRPIPSIGSILNIISKSLVFGIVGCIATHNAFDLCFLKLNIGNKYGLCSELKKCPGMINDIHFPLTLTGDSLLAVRTIILDFLLSGVPHGCLLLSLI
jgi:hypothetical protein